MDTAIREKMIMSLPDDDRVVFLCELLRLIDQSVSDKNFDAINSCIEDWDDAIELLSIPGMRFRAWEQFNMLGTDMRMGDK